jgi:hypothetical protein
MRRRSPVPLAIAMLLVALFGAVFLAAVGIDALEGRNEWQFYADSSTYHELARGSLVGVEEAGDLVTVAANFIGPLAILRLAGENYYAVLAINAVLMLLAITSIAKTLQFDPLRYGALLFVNPLTVSSLLSVNKEVLSLVVVALLLRALAKRSVLLLACAAAASLLVRWQLMLALFVIAAMIALAPPEGHRRSLLIALLIILSVVYVALLPVFEPIRATFELSASEYEGSGAYEWLVGMQESGAYWLVFPLKAAHLLFGLGLRFDRLVTPSNTYNDVWQLLHSTTMLVMFVALWRGGRIRLDNDIIFISVVYIAIFALSPIYSPRYFYVVYLLWTAALACPTRIIRFPRTSSRSRRRIARTEFAAVGRPDPQTR